MRRCAGRHIDLAPAESCLSPDERSHWVGFPSHKYSIAFDELLSTDVRPTNLFTCQRVHHNFSQVLRSPGNQALHRYLHTTSEQSAAERLATAASLADVAIGMPVRGSWVTGQLRESGGSLAELCAAGEPLACARHTWMSGHGANSLEVLLLADCRDLTSANGSDAVNGHSPFTAAMAPWLQPSPSSALLDVRCYFAPYSGLGASHRKTAVLFHALVERHARKRWYMKVDADAILRPNNLLLLLNFFETEATPPTATPIYFGNHWGAFNCTGLLTSRYCRNLIFLTNPPGCAGHGSADCNVSKGTRLRATPGWEALSSEISREGGWKIDSYAHFVTYAAGGVCTAAQCASNPCTHRLISTCPHTQPTSHPHPNATLTLLTLSPSHPLTLSPLSPSHPSHPLALSPSHPLTLSPSHPLTLSSELGADRQRSRASRSPGASLRGDQVRLPFGRHKHTAGWLPLHLYR